MIPYSVRQMNLASGSSSSWLDMALLAACWAAGVLLGLQNAASPAHPCPVDGLDKLRHLAEHGGL